LKIILERCTIVFKLVDENRSTQRVPVALKPVVGTDDCCDDQFDDADDCVDHESLVAVFEFSSLNFANPNDAIPKRVCG
jgi:hypothetical protein